MIVRGLRIISRQLIYLTIVVAIVLTLLITGVYWLSNAVEERQDEIATWVSSKLGYPVEIGSASLDWVGIKPKLQISNLAVLSENHQQELIVLGNLHLGLDLIASVQNSQPVLNDLTIHNLKLAIVRDYSGQIQLQDFNLPTASSEQEFDWKSWVILLDSFHFENISVAYTDQLNPSLSGQYKLVVGAVTHQNTDWTATGNVMPPSLLGQNIVFTAQAELNDDASKIGAWQGQTKIVDLQIGELAQGYQWQDIMMPKGRFSAQFSVAGMGSQIDVITTDFKLFQTTLASSSNDSPAVELDSVQGKADWKRSGQSWRLSGRTQLSINGDDWPETAFTIDKEGDDWQVIAQYLRLSDLTSVAQLSSNTPEIILQQQIAGDIEALDLHYSVEDGLTKLDFKLKEGVALPWQDYPGVSNLTAQFNWEKGLGNIQFDSHNLTLYAKAWLDDTLFFDAITGVVQLSYEQEAWQLESTALRVWNEDLSLQLDGEINKTNDGKIINDLTLALADIKVNQWKKYVPRQNMDPDFKEWSNNAFVAGNIISGEITLKGDLAAFPYEKEPEKGAFSMVLDVENVQLHYGPGWPDLFGLTGTITGSGNDLIIKTKQGKTAGFDFIDVTTIITALTESKPILDLDGEVTGTTAKALQFLKDSPLKQRFGEVANSVLAKGKSNIKLNLKVPLADVDNTTVSGYVSFIDSQLIAKDIAEAALTQVNGKLFFSEKAVKAKNIKGMILKEAVNINVKPDGDKAIISMLGHINTQDIRAVWPEKLPKFITGRTAYQVDLTVVERELGQFYLDFDLISDLKGLALAMPMPFAKKSATAIPFNATMKNIDDTLVYTADFGDVLNIIAKPNDSLWQGEIRFGKGQAVLPKNGIKLSGQLDELSVDDWLQWSTDQASNTSVIAHSIDDVSISLAKLTGYEQTINNLNISSQKDAEGWRTHIDSDQVRGFIYLPDDLSGSSPIKADLERLAISLPKKIEEIKEPQNTPRMALWPSIEISINSLILDDRPLGQLTISANKSESQWTINSAKLVSDTYTLVVPNGVWQKTEITENTAIQLQLESNDLDLLLADFGYQQAIDAEKVTMKANISWPNNPLEFKLAELAGTLNMDIGKGILQDVEPGAAGRIFGLMSIAALPRRLSLDFSDLFGKGFTFDSITGDFKFQNGLALTDNFTLKSASAEIGITGAADLVNQQYQQQVKITPNVASTLPLAGAVAGGPVGLGVGAVILLVDKLTGKLFDKNIVNLISYKYDLTGPWDEPELTVYTPEKQKNNIGTNSAVIR